MRLCSIQTENTDSTAICFPEGVLPLKLVQNELPLPGLDLIKILDLGTLENIRNWYERISKNDPYKYTFGLIRYDDLHYAPLLRQPGKIWGIGLNYREHAGDLSEKPPEEIPGSFMKATTTIIGYGDTIKLPVLSQRTTGEAELGIVIGKTCKNVLRENWLEVVAGFTTIIDMTAEDILRRNPRYLTVCKNFDTFFSIGPQLVTPDEIGDILKLEVATVLNGKVHAKNIVANMSFTPDFLVSFHSQVMTLHPGDVISTGTPRAVVLADGDFIECRISGFEPLRNPVIDLKKRQK